MKKFITITTACLIAALTLTGCSEKKSVNVNVGNDSSISGNVLGKSALREIGDGLWYDTTTRIVYWWNGNLGTSFVNKYQSDTTPSPYYAPNGLPYRYNPETNTFEEIAYDT